MRAYAIVTAYVAVVALALVLTACAGTTSDACKGDSSCVLTEALAQQDVSRCSQLSEAMQVWCITQYAKNTGNEADCAALPAKSKPYCVRDAIIAKGDVGACDRLDGTTRDDCYDHFARNESSWQTCLSMSLGEYREKCIDTISRRTLDPYGCLKMDDLDQNKVGCILSTSIQSMNVQTCKLLPTNESDACLTNIALNARNSSLCTQLPDKYTTWCKQSVNGTMNLTQVRQQFGTA